MSTQRIPRRLKVWLAPALLALALVLAAASALAGPPAQAPDTPQGVAAPPATVPSKISYQGRLTDLAGAPLNDAVDMVFQFWTDALAGGQVGDDIVLNDVPVRDGLFTVQLDLPQAQVVGQALWLAVKVNAQWLGPRQQVLAVPYALGLRPGAHIEGVSAGAVLTLTNSSGLALSATGQRGVEASGVMTGIVGAATASGSRGVVGFGDNYASVGVYGQAGFGTGVLGDGEIGVKGTSHLGSGVSGDGVIGVSGRSTSGYGVSGTSTGSSGVYGVSASSNGVYGVSTSGRGVYGVSTSSFGVYGSSDSNYGVYGLSTSSRGVYGSGMTGVYGNSSATNGFGLYTNDNLFVGGNCVGCTLALVARNTGEAAIAPGDVVVIAGIVPSPTGKSGTPRVAVRRAEGNPAGVALGVATGRCVPAALNAAGEVTQDGYLTEQPAAKDDDLVVVYQGLARLKVSAADGPIHIGDRLALAGGSAAAHKADATAPTSRSVGYALEALTNGDGLVWALLAGQ